MSSKLKEFDKELLLSNRKFEYNSSISSENAYFGGYFGNDSEDYVEVLIYDINDNLLETSVADSTDYYYDDEKGGMKLKTGTILRKLGYDRGRFKVTYNFLRKLAGSYETVVTDENDEIFNGDVDINQIDKSLFIKENKYISHEISPSRTEIRLVPQKIKNEKYIRDFYRLAATNKKVVASPMDSSNIEFVGDTNSEKRNSKTIKFSNSETNPQFEDSMKNGKIIIPNVFIVGYESPPTPISPEELGKTPSELTGTEALEASFYLDQAVDGTRFTDNNLKNAPGDIFFSPAYDIFKNLNYNQDIPMAIQNFDTFDFQGDGRKIEDIRNLKDSAFDPIWVKRNDPEPVLDFASNSTLRADAATTYTWEVFGWDKDDGGVFKKDSYDRIQPRDVGATSGGSFRIITPSAEYATRTPENSFKASQTIAGETGSDNERQGSKLRVELFGNGLRIGIKLTIKDNTSNQTSTIALPAIIETHN